MKKLISFLPVFAILALSYYAFRSYEQLSQATTNGLIFLPHILAIITLAAAIHFKRNSVFFFTLIIISTYLGIKINLTAEPIILALFCCLACFLLVSYTLMSDRGIFSRNNADSFLLFFMTLGFAIFTVSNAPVWENFLLQSFLPIKYFDWTALAQAAVFAFCLSLIASLIIFALKPAPLTASTIGILIFIFLSLHFNSDIKSLIIFPSAALLLCLYAIVQESWRMAYIDDLTGLPGRRALREKFQELNGIYSVAMLDVDHFKKFNDTYGHDVGDTVLKMIASQISKVSGGGVAYRYGGEEFSVIFSSKDTAQAKEYLELVRENIASQEFVVNRENRRGTSTSSKPKKKKTVQITISIGLADSTEKRNIIPDSPWDVLKMADKALYRAKKKGRNCLSV